jgi:LacI family transcriptional regulator
MNRSNVLPNQNGRKVTIQEIADLAGVSVSTVSNVMNNKHSKASQATIDKIYRLVEEYSFAPNLNARSLVTATSNLLGVLYYTQKPQIDFSDPFLADVLTGIEAASKKFKKFILVHGFSNLNDIQLIQQSWKFDGYVVIGVLEEMHDQITQLLHSPVVFIDTYLSSGLSDGDVSPGNASFGNAGSSDLSLGGASQNSEAAPSSDESPEADQPPYPRFYVHNDDYHLSKKVTSYLIGRGHKKIAVFAPMAGKDEPGVVQERYAGYSSALAESRIPLDPSLFFDEYSEAQLVERHQDYTAVLANSDYLAARLYTAFREYQITDKSLVGFDNSFFGSILTPALTTVALNQKRKGQKAVEVLCTLDEITDPGNPSQEIVISGFLVERDSVIDISGEPHEDK